MASNQFLKFLKDTEKPSRENNMCVYTQSIHKDPEEAAKGLNDKKLPPRRLFEEREGVGVK